MADDQTCRELHLKAARKLIHKSRRLYAMLPVSPIVDCKAAIIENRIPERFYPVNVGMED
jgi:hypothetical protein